MIGIVAGEDEGESEGALPEGWVWATLGELGVEAQPGFASGRHNRIGEGVPHLRPMNVSREGRIDLSDVRYVSDASDRRVINDDVLFNNTNSPVLVGKTALVRSPTPLAYSNHMTRLRSPSGLIPAFLALRLHSLWLRGYFQEILNHHVNQASVATKKLLETPIALPPLAEQRRIVETLEDHLSLLDAAMANLKRCSARTTGLLNRVRATQTGGYLETLPPRWKWGSLNDVLERVEAGQSFRCEPRPAEEAEWGVIKVSAMTWGEFREFEQKAVPTGKEIDTRYEIRPNDILVSRANTSAYVGAPVLVRQCRPRLLLSDKSLRLVPKEDMDRSWLLSVLSSPPTRAQISAKATGTKESMRNISQRDLLNVRIPIPPPKEQLAISDHLDVQTAQISKLVSELSTTRLHGEKLKQALLHNAFTGRLVPQDPADEPASVLLARIKEERAAREKAAPKRARRAPAKRAVPASRSRTTEPPPATSSAPIPTHAVQQAFDVFQDQDQDDPQTQDAAQ